MNHAIQPGCVRWEQPTSKEKSDSHSIDYISPFPASISNDWVPDVEIDDTPPLTSNSDDSDSDSDTEVEKSRNRLLKKINIGQQSRTSFRCPVAGCPKASSKPWKNVATLHGHLADHCVGKFQGTVPLEYFDQWDKQFCSKCGSLLLHLYSVVAARESRLLPSPRFQTLPIPYPTLIFLHQVLATPFSILFPVRPMFLSLLWTR